MADHSHNEFVLEEGDFSDFLLNILIKKVKVIHILKKTGFHPGEYYIKFLSQNVLLKFC